MPPEVLVFLIPILAILTGMLSIVLKHREKMAGLDGKRGGSTIQLLTETLEKEHARIQQLEKRIETLEMIVTDGPDALGQPARRVELPPATEDADDVLSPARPRTRS